VSEPFQLALFGVFIIYFLVGLLVALSHLDDLESELIAPFWPLFYLKFIWKRLKK